MIDIRQPGWAGCALAFLALLQGWLLCGGFCVPCKCAKNSVGSGRQSHGCLFMCRMFNRVAYNVRAWRCGDIPCYVSPDMLLTKDMKMKIYSIAGLYSSD